MMTFNYIFKSKPASEVVAKRNILPSGWSIKNDEPESDFNLRQLELFEPSEFKYQHPYEHLGSRCDTTVAKAFKFAREDNSKIIVGSLSLGESIYNFPRQYSDLLINFKDSTIGGKFYIFLPRTTLWSDEKHKRYCFLEAHIRSKLIATFKFMFGWEYQTLRYPVTFLTVNAK